MISRINSLRHHVFALQILAGALSIASCRGNAQSDILEPAASATNLTTLQPAEDANTMALKAFDPTSGQLMMLRVAGDTNLCLDVQGANTAPGAAVIASPCHNGENQKWRLVNGQLRVYDALCLTAGNPNTSASSQVVTAACSALESDQKWTLDEHELKAQTAGLCVSGDTNSTLGFSPLRLTVCASQSANNLWTPQPALMGNDVVQANSPTFSSPLAAYVPANTSTATPAQAPTPVSVPTPNPAVAGPARPGPVHIKGPVQTITVPLFQNFDFPGGWGFNQVQKVALPSADVLARFDTMDVTLDLRCPRGASCGPWDFVASLSACSTPTANTPPSSCANEIARWVTPYGLPGTWTTRISDMLAIIRDGGPQYFSFSTPQAYQISITLTLSSIGSGFVPVKATPLYGGGDLNAGFNSSHTGKSVSLDFAPDMARIYALGTGHGWGTTSENCAEFCNLTQEFLVNGSGISYDGGPAIYDASEGCQKRAGVVQNQAGTYQYGRNGWCPGADVIPKFLYVTGALHPGKNDVDFRVLRNNAVYVPTFTGNPSGNGINPMLTLSSYLVEWRTAVVE